MSRDPELLVGLSSEELEELADLQLGPSGQARLDELLERNTRNELAADEQAELDRILARIDQLNLLMARARHTLNQQGRRTDQPGSGVAASR